MDTALTPTRIQETARAVRNEVVELRIAPDEAHHGNRKIADAFHSLNCRGDGRWVLVSFEPHPNTSCLVARFARVRR
jgi:hypothetical protein